MGSKIFLWCGGSVCITRYCKQLFKWVMSEDVPNCYFWGVGGVVGGREKLSMQGWINLKFAGSWRGFFLRAHMTSLTLESGAPKIII